MKQCFRDARCLHQQGPDDVTSTSETSVYYETTRCSVRKGCPFASKPVSRCWRSKICYYGNPATNILNETWTSEGTGAAQTLCCAPRAQKLSTVSHSKKTHRRHGSCLPFALQFSSCEPPCKKRNPSPAGNIISLPLIIFRFWRLNDPDCGISKPTARGRDHLSTQSTKINPWARQHTIGQSHTACFSFRRTVRV
jgi:hypothetical protein